MPKKLEFNKRPMGITEKDQIEGIDIQIQLSLRNGLLPTSLLAFLQVVQHNVIHQMIAQAEQNEEKRNENARNGKV